MQPLGKDRQRALLRDLVQGGRDVMDLAKEHKVSLEQLAQWAEGAAVQRHLASLCSLADAQAQFQLSRYRLHVAQRLLQDAMQDDGKDLTRKARLEAMKLEVWQPFAAAPEGSPAEGASTEAEDTEAALRALLAAQPQEGGGHAEHA